MLTAALLSVVVWVYRGVPAMAYVLWDDDGMVVENALLRQPWTAALKAAFGGFYSGDYIPMTLMSYWLEVRAFGFDPGVQHTVNLGLHLLNIVLLAVLLPTIGALGRWSWVVLIAFALHPAQVESVAWVSERKGLLATAGYFAALLCATQVDAPGRRRLMFGIGYLMFFLFASMSKANGLLLPVWFWLVQAIRQHRARVDGWPWHLLAMATAAGFAALRIMAYASALPDLQPALSEAQRLLNWPLQALAALGFYLKLLAWPRSLSIIYPPFGGDESWSGATYGGAVVLLFWGISLGRWRQKEAFIWLSFAFFTLLPVLHLVPRLNFVNDRYLYLAIIGLVAGSGLLFGEWWRWAMMAAGRPRLINPAPIFHLGVCLLLIVAWLPLSHARAGVWASNLALWADTVAKAPKNSLALNNLGQAYQEQGQLAEAIASYQKSLDLVTDRGGAILAYNNLATLYSSRSYPQYFDLGKAKALLEAGINAASRPDDGLVLRFNLALVELQGGDVEAGKKTLADLAASLRQNPNQRYAFLMQRVQSLEAALAAPPTGP